jgi:hypothetical protein
MTQSDQSKSDDCISFIGKTYLISDYSIYIMINSYK